MVGSFRLSVSSSPLSLLSLSSCARACLSHPLFVVFRFRLVVAASNRHVSSTIGLLWNECYRTLRGLRSDIETRVSPRDWFMERIAEDVLFKKSESVDFRDCSIDFLIDPMLGEELRLQSIGFFLRIRFLYISLVVQILHFQAADFYNWNKSKVRNLSPSAKYRQLYVFHIVYAYISPSIKIRGIYS